MRHHKMRFFVGTLAMAALLVTTASQAGSSAINYMTLGRLAALPGVVLDAGAYTFEVSPKDFKVVRVWTREGRQRLMYTGLTNLVTRPAGMPRDRVLSFGEARPGEPVPITAWFPLGSTTGHQFLR